METKWQEKWNYYGWKEYLDVIPDRPSMQSDWNSTLLTKINQMRNNILMITENTEIGVSVNSHLFNTIINYLQLDDRINCIIITSSVILSLSIIILSIITSSISSYLSRCQYIQNLDN